MRPAIFVAWGVWDEIRHPKPIFGTGFNVTFAFGVIPDMGERGSTAATDGVSTPHDQSLDRKTDAQ
jgi:hypothetical protein